MAQNKWSGGSRHKIEANQNFSSFCSNVQVFSPPLWLFLGLNSCKRFLKMLLTCQKYCLWHFWFLFRRLQFKPISLGFLISLKENDLPGYGTEFLEHGSIGCGLLESYNLSLAFLKGNKKRYIINAILLALAVETRIKPTTCEQSGSKNNRKRD